MKRTLALFLALALAPGAFAQDLSRPWTLKECTQWAMDHNISLHQQENSLKQREIELENARNDRLPSLSVSASENLSFGRGLTADNTYANTNTTSTSFSLGSGVNLFNGFQTKNNILQNEWNLKAVTEDLEKARDDIRVTVARNYFQILYDMEILDVAERQIGIDSAQVARLEALFANGKASPAEVAQQKAALAQSCLTRTQAENTLSLALLDLAQLLELPSPEGFRIVRPDTGMELRLLEKPEDIYAEAVRTKPAVKAEEFRLEQAGTSVAIAKGRLYPSLSLSGGIGSNYYTTTQGYPQASFWDQLSNNFSQYVGLSLNVPIFNKFQTRNQIRSAQLNRQTQELQLENVKKGLYKEIQQAWYNASASEDKYMASKAASESYEEAFRLVEARYENGKANITEFNEAKNQYLRAESELLQARYEYLFQTRLLDFYKNGALDL